MSDGITDYEATRREWVRAFEDEERAKNAAIAERNALAEERKREQYVWFRQLQEFERDRAKFVKVRDEFVERCEDHTRDMRGLKAQLEKAKRYAADIESVLLAERKAKKRAARPKLATKPKESPDVLAFNAFRAGGWR